jgi:hypothetical protein
MKGGVRTRWNKSPRCGVCVCRHTRFRSDMVSVVLLEFWSLMLNIASRAPPSGWFAATSVLFELAEVLLLAARSQGQRFATLLPLQTTAHICQPVAAVEMLPRDDQAFRTHFFVGVKYLVSRQVSRCRTWCRKCRKRDQSSDQKILQSSNHRVASFRHDFRGRDSRAKTENRGETAIAPTRKRLISPSGDRQPRRKHLPSPLWR